jgi:uncharacterized protein YbaA (DUF1428 family)
MSKSNLTKIEEEKTFGSQIMIVVGRVPKKNHDATVQIFKQFNDIFRKHGGLCVEFFQLNNTKTYEDIDLINIVNTVSANQEDEDVWVELQYYRDRNHMDEVIAKMGNDENCGRLYKQSLDLLTPGTSFILGEFGRLKI